MLYANQLVDTEDGPLEIRNIYERWKRGEKIRVRSFDESTHDFEWSLVKRAWKREAQSSEFVHLGFDKSYLVATRTQIVLTTIGWKAAEDLVSDDELLGFKKSLAITGIEVYGHNEWDDEDVYDLDVETHAFVCTRAPVVMTSSRPIT